MWLLKTLEEDKAIKSETPAASSSNAANLPATEAGEDDDAGDDDDAGEEEAGSPSNEPMSKKQMKRLAKRQLVKDKRKEKKQAVKEAKRAKREASQAAWDAMSPEEQAEQKKQSLEVRQQRVAADEAAKAAAAAAEDPSRVIPTCVLDLDFHEFHGEREVASLAQQLSYSYCANRRSGFPMRLVFASLGGALEAKLTTGYKNWIAVRREAANYQALYPKERLVYLSSEAEEVLDGSLDPEAVYVIGGLVDHNRQKGLTHQRAIEAGIRTVRLPIDEHMVMSQRRILAVNHCVEILVYVASGLSWAEALVKVMPERRHAVARPGEEGGEEEAQEEDS